MLFQLPGKSRIFKKYQPANEWGWQEVLLNKANYLLEVLTWQKTKDAQKKNPSKAPKLFVPDFMIKLEQTRAINKDSIKYDVEDIKAILAKPRV